MILTKDQILSVNDWKKEEVNVPEWGDDATVIVRSLSAKERSIIEQKWKKVTNGGVTATEVMVEMVCMATIDDNNQRVFRIEDSKLLMEKNGEVINRLFLAIQDISGLGGKVSDRSKN